ncbi:uncharacterized protein [Aegilops tauschii subsp. strangulata]|uniref:uncharacterized protein isoform X5 n=1 Tax=Aegilops tauschii subsp. strangulata TaxID=200361 RepID=UPI001ABC4322|nr:uncharacterized protein LOC109748610 isoform X4 [Aegilops tauschii subsp. strangulata]
MNRPSPLKKKRVAPLLPPPLRVQKPPAAAAVSAGMSTWNSVVTAHKPTSVSRSFVGDFTSSTSPSYCQTFQEMRPLSRRRPFIQRSAAKPQALNGDATAGRGVAGEEIGGRGQEVEEEIGREEVKEPHPPHASSRLLAWTPSP